MSGRGIRPARPIRPTRPTEDGSGATGSGDGWTAVSYLLGGMAVYGGIGWAIGHWVWHSPLFFPLGMVIGLALATVLIIFSFGRS
jgi:F0F1-type ATP synthase assembly protein I